MTYKFERVRSREFESRLHKMASTGETLVAFCKCTDGNYELVVDPPKESAHKPPALPPKHDHK